MKIWLRWIAVLPGALLGGFLATFPLHWILVFWIFPHNGSSFSDLILFDNPINVKGVELALTPLVIAMFYILAGTEIAPKYKMPTAFILSALFLVGMIFIFISARGEAAFSIGTFDALLGLFLGVVIVWFMPRPNARDDSPSALNASQN